MKRKIRTKEEIQILKTQKPPLCTCGCNNEVTWSKEKYKWNIVIQGHNGRTKPIPETKLCECGFGEYTKPGNRFIYSHQRKGAKQSKEVRRNLSILNGGTGILREDIKPPLCNCGCREEVAWSTGRNKWNKYVHGHNGKGLPSSNKGRKITKEERRKRSVGAGGTGILKEDIEPKLCECGCGEYTTILNGRARDFIHGHNSIANSDIIKEQGKERWKDLDYREMQVDSHKRYCSIPENIKRMSIITTKRFEDQEQRDIVSIGVKRYNKENNIDHSGKNSYWYGKFGPESANWKGGVSRVLSKYCEVWLDLEYKESIRIRDNHTCQNPDCWNTCNDETLNIHHINYNKKDCRPINLITLCRSCNSRANKNRKYWEELYIDINTYTDTNKRIYQIIKRR